MPNLTEKGSEGILYRGKAKTLRSTEHPEYLILEFRNDTSSGDGARIEQFEYKGVINNALSHFLMQKLEQAGVPTQLVCPHIGRPLSANEVLVKKLDMLPVECVIRNRASGSLVRRLGIEEGRILSPPLFELFLKDDARHDPMVNSSYCETFGWATRAQLQRLQVLSRQTNEILSQLFDEVGLILVDFKLEFGLFKGDIVLGDEISPDGARLWDKKTGEKLDKDRFRENLGGLVDAYEEVARRLGVNVKK